MLTCIRVRWEILGGSIRVPISVNIFKLASMRNSIHFILLLASITNFWPLFHGLKLLTFNFLWTVYLRTVHRTTGQLQPSGLAVRIYTQSIALNHSSYYREHHMPNVGRNSGKDFQDTNCVARANLLFTSFGVNADKRYISI